MPTAANSSNIANGRIHRPRLARVFVISLLGSDTEVISPSHLSRGFSVRLNNCWDYKTMDPQSQSNHLKRGRDRPVEREMPEPIPDTPESIAGRACKARPRRSGLPQKAR